MLLFYLIAFILSIFFVFFFRTLALQRKNVTCLILGLGWAAIFAWFTRYLGGVTHDVEAAFLSVFWIGLLIAGVFSFIGWVWGKLSWQKANRQ